MRIPSLLAPWVLGAVTLPSCRCGSESTESPPRASAAPEPVASSNRAPSLEEVSQAIGAPPVPVTCPAGSSGKGSPHEPCLGKGRWLKATWTGKIDAPGALFRVTNALDRKIEFETGYTYYYDRSGRRLPVRLPGEPASAPAHESTNTAGELFSIDPGETKEVYLGLPKQATPRGTAKVEAEFPRLGFRPGGKDVPLGYWFNDSLIAPERPLGGHPQ